MASTSATPVIDTTAEEVVVKEKKMLVLKSSEGESFEVDSEVASLSEMIKNLLEDDVGDIIPLPNVNSAVLAHIINYCNKHYNDVDATPFSSELSSWDQDFVKVNINLLFDIMMAANYLNIKSLIDLTTQTAADNIKDKTVEEVREIFNIVNDFTPEEEAAIRKEHAWAFDI